jgi:hypothetical protein
MFCRKDIRTLNLIIFLIALFFPFQAQFAVAKFGEAPIAKGNVKCCFRKTGGFLSGRCLEMREKECILKQGVAVKDCKECGELGRDKGKRR